MLSLLEEGSSFGSAAASLAADEPLLRRPELLLRSLIRLSAGCVDKGGSRARMMLIMTVGNEPCLDFGRPSFCGVISRRHSSAWLHVIVPELPDSINEISFD